MVLLARQKEGGGGLDNRRELEGMLHKGRNNLRRRQAILGDEPHEHLGPPVEATLGTVEAPEVCFIDAGASSTVTGPLAARHFL